ncbi:Oocyte zinc finger protein XlCOF6 [Folsomia candida]|uniref:Oocyte zinc finger protein XlCOF6 n=1 Tax=Folsomia candida TaxID=158441 RepID=A0A226D1N4_FOLCA|nr:Oocyte zinc finger protein XlCOF6 [Folsomia candida]
MVQTFLEGGIHGDSRVGTRNFMTSTCGACFTEKTSLDRHTRGHTGERPYACPHCDKAFKMRRDIRNHVKVIHTPGYVAPTPHKCPHCDKGYRTPFWLRCHIRQSHTRERPFVCDQCGKGFTVKSGLSRHLKTAHGIFPEKTNRLPRL